MSKKLTNQEFIERAKFPHGDKYDYSMVEYVKNKINVKIICKKHGEFEQRPDVHLVSGCKKCSDDIKKMNVNQFIISANKIKCGDLYKKTIEREKYLKSLGYNVASIWESEYKKEL
jgi:hypothetical protein